MNFQRTCAVVLCMLAAAAFATSAHAQDPDQIGTIDIDGVAAYINGHPAAQGEAVLINDTVSTGGSTGVRVWLTDGGYVQLDESTDPLFGFFEEGACIVITMAKGQMLVDAKHVCIGDDQIAAELNSVVNLRSRGGRSELTVISGHVELTRPQHLALAAGEGYELASDGRGERIAIPSDELRSTTAWARGYHFADFPPASLPPPQSSIAWCCSNGSVYESRSGRCDTDPAYRAAAAARAACASGSQSGAVDTNGYEPPPPPPPQDERWCCLEGHLLSEDRCRGAELLSYARARSICRNVDQPPPTIEHPESGWCCSQGRDERMTQLQCRQRDGTFSTQRGRCPAQEPEQPQPPHQQPTPEHSAWCCANGSVMQLPPAQCTERHGRVYKTSKDANAACKVIVN